MRQPLGPKTEKALHVIAAKRMIVGILGCERERRLVTHSERTASELHKRVRAHKHGHLGRRRPEQKEALQKALTQLVNEGLVIQKKLSDGRVVLTLTTRPATAVRSKARTQPKRRASASTRKKAA